MNLGTQAEQAKVPLSAKALPIRGLELEESRAHEWIAAVAGIGVHCLQVSLDLITGIP